MAVDQANEHAQVTEPTTHVHDYSVFIKWFKWSAVVCFLIAMAVLVIISN